MTLQSINWSKITFKSLNFKEAMGHCLPMEAVIAFFAILATRGAQNKNAAAMVNFKNVVGKNGPTSITQLGVLSQSITRMNN